FKIKRANQIFRRRNDSIKKINIHIEIFNRGMYSAASAYTWHKQRFGPSVAAQGKIRVGMHRVVEGVGPGRVKNLFREGYQIRKGVPFFVEEAIHLFAAGVGSFFYIVRNIRPAGDYRFRPPS
ncbi:MAG: hypothetical protein R6V21_00990, partial [Pelovirga sp.]